VSSPPTHEKHSLRILDAFESDHHVSQRSLARELGVALGLTNLLVRRLVAKGYVRLAGMGTRHVWYLMTPEGLEALGRATKASLENTLHLYTETREQIRAGLNLVSARCPADESGQKRVVFYGAGDVAEIAYISLQSTDLALVGVIDDQRKGRFFDLEISDPGSLTAQAVGGTPYSHIVITSLRHADSIRKNLESRHVDAERVFSL